MGSTGRCFEMSRVLSDYPRPLTLWPPWALLLRGLLLAEIIMDWLLQQHLQISQVKLLFNVVELLLLSLNVGLQDARPLLQLLLQLGHHPELRLRELVHGRGLWGLRGGGLLRHAGVLAAGRGHRETQLGNEVKGILSLYQIL